MWVILLRVHVQIGNAIKFTHKGSVHIDVRPEAFGKQVCILQPRPDCVPAIMLQLCCMAERINTRSPVFSLLQLADSFMR